MQRLLISFLALGTLAGCTIFDDSSNRQGIMLDSETCRSSAETDLGASPVTNDQTSQDRERFFDKTYRACMATKGYDLPAEAASTR